VPDGALLTSKLPLPGGITFQSGGTFRRQELESVLPTINANHAVEYEYSLKSASGIAHDVEFSCCKRVQTGVELEACTPALLKVGPPRMIRR
jgi:hypothetical protein